MSEFKSQLRYCGFTKKSFAHQFDVHPDTVTRWGDHPPRWVWRYLAMCAHLRLLVEEHTDLVVAPPKRRGGKIENLSNRKRTSEAGDGDET